MPCRWPNKFLFSSWRENVWVWRQSKSFAPTSALRNKIINCYVIEFFVFCFSFTSASSSCAQFCIVCLCCCPFQLAANLLHRHFPFANSDISEISLWEERRWRRDAIAVTKPTPHKYGCLHSERSRETATAAWVIRNCLIVFEAVTNSNSFLLRHFCHFFFFSSLF